MAQPTQKLFLLDALALIYRAHFAFNKNPRLTSKGVNTSAVFGFMNALLEVLQKEKPTHIGVAFDTAKKTFRHEQFDTYKANRQAQPEDITIAIPYIQQLMAAMNIPVLLLEGYEADDIIGTLAKKAALEGFEVFMMTPDKDYGQLVEEHIHIYKPAFMGKPAEKLGVQDVCDRWQIERIAQVTDMLGLVGDSVDNIPGIPGIGEKTAQKLIAEFGSLENIIARADELKGKLRENIVNFAQQGMLSKELATIHLNVPIAFEAESLRHSDYDTARLSALLDELEFRTMKARLIAIPPSAQPLPEAFQAKPKPAVGAQMDLFGGSAEPQPKPQQPIATGQTPTPDEPVQADTSTAETPTAETPAAVKTISTTVHDYRLVDTPALRESLAYFLGQQTQICFDTETTDVDPIEAELVGLSFAWQPGEAFYVPVPPDAAEATAIVREFAPVLSNPAIEKIGQNLKYDMLVLEKYGVTVQGKLFDTMLAHYLIEPEKRHGMDLLAYTYLNYRPVEIETLIGKKGKGQLSMRDVPVETVTDYAAEDADITLQLKEALSEPLKTDNLTKLFDEVEMPLVRVLVDMEAEGVTLDTAALADLSATLTTDIAQVQQEIYTLAGAEFNIGSPKQLGEVLFDKLKLDSSAKTRTGQYATGEEVLSKLEEDHEIARKILDYRELVKLKNTYVDVLPQLISPRTGRIHTSFNQAVAATGRLSSANPNLQNIPIRTPRGQEIRKAFVPRSPDYVILSADYSQIELRIMAAFSGDQTMLDAFNEGVDIHTQTAGKVFGVPLDAVTPEMRRRAKTINFGIIYGISSFGLAQRLKIPRKEAGQIIEDYFAGFPAVKGFIEESIAKARGFGYAETILGRRRYLRDINSRNQTDRMFAERNAVNAPIQGSAADMLKVAMIQIHDYLQREQLRSKMMLTVHDELVFDAHRDELPQLQTHVAELMRNAIPMAVKMEVGMGIGQNWLEAH